MEYNKPMQINLKVKVRNLIEFEEMIRKLVEIEKEYNCKCTLYEVEIV